MVDKLRLQKTGEEDDDGAPVLKKSLSIKASLMTPVKPMLVGVYKLGGLLQTY